MRQFFTLLAAGLLSASFGQGGGTNSGSVYPQENFAVLEATLPNGKPAVGSFNLAYKEYGNKAQYPWCLIISIGLKLEHCKENGLPENEEIAVANQFEGELLEKVSEITTAHYVGHLFNDTFLDVYIYIENPEEVHQWLQTQINKEGLTRGFGYEITQDPLWETVAVFMR